LLDDLDVASLGDADRAHLDLIRARILFTAGGSGETVVLMTAAARRLEVASSDLARATYLHAFSAGTFLGRDVTADQWLDLGQAGAHAPLPGRPPGARDTLLEGLALQLTAGYAPALGQLRRALQQLVAADGQTENLIEVLWLASCMAIVLWDDNSWNALSEKFVNEGRRTGAIVHLLAAVQMHAIERVLAGDFAEAASRIAEKNLLTSVIGLLSSALPAAATVPRHSWPPGKDTRWALWWMPPARRRHRCGVSRPTSPATRLRCCAMPWALSVRDAGRPGLPRRRQRAVGPGAPRAGRGGHALWTA
jgi:hypothetical protein